MKNDKHSTWPDTITLSDELRRKLRPVFEHSLRQEAIQPEPQLLDNYSKFYLPLSAWIAQQHQQVPVIIGINGSQGSGKSTLSKILSRLLQQGFDKQVVVLSIDDLYKTHQQRQEMARSVHPLFATRGVPGTHDIEQGLSILAQLKQQTANVRLPVFDKASDDRKDEKDWPVIKNKPDIILFEGWCVGSVAEAETELSQAINELEENQDSDSRWRQYVNQQLETDYQQLFSMLDKLIMLKIPDFDKIIKWRTEQENKLKTASENQENNQTMSTQELEKFIMHFERLTRHTLSEMPDRADVVLELGLNHQIQHARFKHN